MNKVGLGGSSPFAIPMRPNIITPLTPDETMERRGESVLHFRFKPCPCPPSDRNPDCKIKGCYDGHVRDFQKTALIVEESSYKIRGHEVFTRYSPIEAIEKAEVMGTPKEELHVTEIFDDHFHVSAELEYWRSVAIDYRVKTIIEIVIEVEGENEYRLILPGMDKRILVEVDAVYRRGINEPLDFIGHDLTSIYFKERMNGSFNVKCKISRPFKIGYKTWTVDQSKTEPAKLNAQSGDLVVVVPTYFNLGTGDIITLLYSSLRHSQYVPFKEGNTDRLPYAPVKYIESLHSKENGKIVEKEWGKDFIVYGFDRLYWLTEKPRDGYSISYDYHPSFRVSEKIEGEGGEDRHKPKQFICKPISSFNPRMMK